MEKPEDLPDTVKATVKVEKTDYLVAYPLEDCGILTKSCSVTFHRSKWLGEKQPCHGQVVELLGTKLHEKGWRAESARPVIPVVQQHPA